MLEVLPLKKMKELNLSTRKMLILMKSKASTKIQQHILTENGFILNHLIAICMDDIHRISGLIVKDFQNDT